MNWRLMLGLAAGLLLARQARATTVVSEADVTGPCSLGQDKPCPGAKIGTVVQVWPGEDVYVSREGGGYIARYYVFGRVFHDEMRRGEERFDSLAALNETLSRRGFDQVEGRDLTGPCLINGAPCEGAAKGRVLQAALESKDIHVVKKDGRYLAEYYSFAHVFQKEHQRNVDSYSTLSDLNAELTKQGLPAVSEKDVTGPCVINGRRRGQLRGRVLQLSKGKDIHVMKKGGRYLATEYPFGYAFQFPRTPAEFRTLADLNAYLTRELGSR